MTRLLVLAMFSSAAWAQLTPAETAANLASFEQVWRTVRDRHSDPRLNGLDWQAVHDEITQRVLSLPGVL